MVHKRFIKKNGKIYGPYFYKSVRVGNKVKNIYIGSTTEVKQDKQPKTVFVLLMAAAFFAFLFISGSGLFLTGAMVTIESNDVLLEQGRLLQQDGNGYKLSLEREGNRLDITGIKTEPTDIKVEINSLDSRVLNTDIISVDGLSDGIAEIRLKKDGPVDTIFYCKDYDSGTDKCPQWEKTEIPFTDNGEDILFYVTHFTAYAAGSISNLAIYDDTDIYGERYSAGNALFKIAYPYYTHVGFYANYSNSTAGAISGNCSIRFNISGSMTGYSQMIYNSTSKLQEYNRTFSYGGNFTFHVNCTNSSYDELNATDYFFITNTPPYLPGYPSKTNPAMQACNEDSTCTYNASANFTDDDTIDMPLSNYEVSSPTAGFEDCATVTAAGIVSVSCTLESQAGGPYNLSITVSDGESSEILVTKWTITAVNDAPVIATASLDAATENIAYTDYISITDEEQGSITDGIGAVGNFSFYVNDTSVFTVNRTTGKITNNTAITNDMVGNTYYLKFNVTDNAIPTNSTTEKDLSISISGVNDAPNITYACDSSLSQTEDTPFSCYINATDIDAGESHTYTANYSWFNFTCTNVPVTNGNSSCLVNFAPNDTAVYAHWVTITVNDGEATDSVSINFTVDNVPDFPRFTNISNMTAWGGAPFTYQVEAMDDDNATQFGETIYYWDNTSLFNISSSGLISFTPTNEQNGSYWINISVNDSTDRWNSSVINFTIYINYAPNFSGLLEYNLTEGYLFTANLSINTTDPENNTFTFTDNTSMFNISSGGVISFTPTDADVRANWVSINITDSYGTISAYSINFTVYNENDVPVLATISNVTNGSEGSTIQFYLTAEDPDCSIPSVVAAGGCSIANPVNYLRYRMNASITGASVEQTTGLFSWNPSATQNGTYWINFTVNDSTGLEDSQVIYITVNDTSYPPRFLDTHPSFCLIREATEDTAFASCTLIACDNDTSPTLRFAANYSWFNSAINRSNISAAYDPAYGYCANTTVNFTPTYQEVGNWTIYLNVTDNMYSTASFNLSFNISSFDDAPVIAHISNLLLTIGSGYSYNLSNNVTDEENDIIYYFANDTLASFNITLNSTTGMLTGTPNSSMNGTYRVNLTVNESSGQQDSYVLTFVVGENFPPTCSSLINTDKGLFTSSTNFSMYENASTGSFIATCADIIEGDPFTYSWYWNSTLNKTGLFSGSSMSWSYTTTFLDAGDVNITLVVNDTPLSYNSYYWNVTTFDINAPPMLYALIGNISTVTSGSGWYKNVMNSRNMTNYFFDIDKDNLTYAWYRYALNDSFDANNINTSELLWSFSGNWSLVNDTANNPALNQTATDGLKYASQKYTTYGDITELKVKVKIISGAAGFCLGDSACTYARRIFLNKTDNTTNLDFVSSSTSVDLSNTYSISVNSSGYIWLKASFAGNLTSVYVSSNNADWGLAYNKTVAINVSASNISLFTASGAAIFDDITVKDPDLRNMTVAYEGGNNISFLPATGWFGDLPMVLTASDGKNTTASNLFYLHIDDITAPLPVVVTQTQMSSSITTLTKVASLDIIVPSMVTLTPLSKTIIPVILNNTGQLDLNTITLVAKSNQTELRLKLNETNWTIIKVGNEAFTSLDVDVGLLTPDRYTIRLEASVTNPRISDFAEIVIDVREKDAALKTQLKEQIQFTRDLFLQNPECLELWELITEAEKMMSLYQYEKGLELVHRAGQGCKDFMSMKKEQTKQADVIKTFIQLHWKTMALELLGLVVAILLLAYYFRRRQFARSL